MLKLRDVSRYFDRTPVTDPVTGALLFKAQFNNYDGSRRDAYAAYRRIMSVDPAVAVPAGQCVRALDSVWLVGIAQADGWEELHRRKFIVHQARARASIVTLAGCLAGEEPQSTWGDLQWIATTTDQAAASDEFNLMLAVLPGGVSVPDYSLVTVGNVTLLVQSSAYFSTGFVEARGQQRGDANVLPLAVTRREFVPAVGRHEAQAVAELPSLQLRWQELFKYTDQLDEHFRPGDTVFAVPEGADVRVSDTVTREGRTWQINGLATLAGVRAIHARRL